MATRSVFAFFLLLQAGIHQARGDLVPCEICSCDTAEVLDCSNRGLKYFLIPDSWDASNITTLKLNGNSLSTIPNLAQFTNLTTLDLSVNRIRSLPTGAFSYLTSLQTLDLSFNVGLILSSQTLHDESFRGLSSLRILKLKQTEAPSIGFAYEQLAPLNRTLEELYISGTPTLSPTFEAFNNLQTLSLGGKGCNLPALDILALKSIVQLPIARLSAKSCNILRVETKFLQSFRSTLRKLDLSCNPLRESLRNITEGVQDSNLNTLLIDNINRVPLPGQSDCTWYNITNEDLRPLQSLPLRILSAQANQFGAYTTLWLRTYCQNLVYLDVSLNNFNGSSLYVVNAYKNVSVDPATKSVFMNPNFQPPSVRYLGLRSLTSTQPCGVPPVDKYSCNEESYLFLDDSYAWDVNYDPDIVDVMLLSQLTEELPKSIRGLACLAEYALDNRIDCIISFFLSKCRELREAGMYAATDAAIIKTVNLIWDDVGHDILKLPKYLFTHRYLLVNLTTLDLGDCKFSRSDVVRENALCSDIDMFKNNAVSLDFSGSEFGFIPCRNISGFPYLTNITVSNCYITGWHEDALVNMPVKFLNFSWTRGLSVALQNDKKGRLFGSAPGLEVLDISNIGINYFTDSQRWSHNPRLTHLFLQKNNLNTWNLTIAFNFYLEILDLRNNFITHINQTFRTEISNQHQRNKMQIFLAGNEVDCSNCKTDDYISWLIKSPAVADSDHIYCRGEIQTIAECFYSEVTTSSPSTSPASPAIPAQEVTKIVLGFVAILAMLIMFAIVFTNRYVIMYHALKLAGHGTKAQGNDYTSLNIQAYACHSESFTDQIAEVIQNLSRHGVKLLSRQTDLPPGSLIKPSIIRLMLQCSKVVVFITPDLIQHQLSRFELDLIKQRDIADLVVVTADVDDVSKLSGLPENIVHVIRGGALLTYPSGNCSSSETNHNAFNLLLLDKLLDGQNNNNHIQ